MAAPINRLKLIDAATLMGEMPPHPMPVGSKAGLTFDRICELEPRIRALWEATAAESLKRQARIDTHFCANYLWVTRFKPELLKLVGWERMDRDAILGTSAAYDIAYDAIYDQLPDCRDCYCLRI